MMTFRFSGQFFAMLLACGFASISLAQRPIPIPKDNFSSAGTIKGIQNGIFHVANVGGDQWLVDLAAEPDEIVLRGKATADWLRPGMPVSFEGTFFKNRSGLPQGEALQPITKLKVFSVREDSKVELKEEAKRGSFLAGPKEDTPMEKAPFTVTGVLVKYKGGKMTVSLGKTQVKAQLAPQAKIDVNINDPRFARIGDDIEFEGWHYVGQDKRIHATKVWITIAKPLGTDATKTVAKRPDDGATEEEQKQAHDIHVAITRARKRYEAGEYNEAAAAITAIIADWDALLDADEDVAARLLRPQAKDLRSVHAFLEMEGFMLPVLRDLPEVEAVAAR